MERLTSRTNNNAVHMETPSLKEVVFKLCEYEDTGLEPEEVSKLKADYDRLNDFEQSQCAKLLKNNSELEEKVKHLTALTSRTLPI